ncbi:hypothetical protein ARMGADRAFT_1085026 [Armillaria gallica]|uniref:Integral membrane protein n=1 Tax=Armillaria gallica TaxID=47427 RepID=A0A2H3D1T9_ARMGA|nr:hypothetical protein ARMGADRAFT_1085026 [Armillaria gallica]
MASVTETPDLPGEETSIISGILDIYFNQIIVYALTHGIYTCVFAVTLWNIFSSKTQRSASRNLMVLAITALYILTTISFGSLWFVVHFGFINDGQNALTVFESLEVRNSQYNVVQTTLGITGIMATDIADAAMIWRCWVIWGGRWFIVFIPILLLIAEIVIKSVQIYHLIHDALDIDLSVYNDTTDWLTMYLSLSLAATLMCTLLIVYRILSVGGVKAGLRTYRGVVEVIVESAALSSTMLVIYTSLNTRNELCTGYADVIASPIKGIAPTLLVGRVAAGHARPDDSWKESHLSWTSLRFGHASSSPAQISTLGGVSDTRSVVPLDEDSSSDRDFSTERVFGQQIEAKVENV